MVKVFELSMCVHELFTLKEKISDVSTWMIIKVVIQNLKINYHSSLDVVICPFLGGIWI